MQNGDSGKKRKLESDAETKLLEPVEAKRTLSVNEHHVEAILMEPYEYLDQMKGKGVRDVLIDAFQLWLKIPDDTLARIKQIVTKLHNASLIVDDIEDSSSLRRGKPAAHKIFGVPSSINCANYVYFQAMDQCRKLDNKEALNCFLDEMLNLHRGQGLDIYWRDKIMCPSESDYKGMVIDKTGGLFRLSIRLLQAFSQCKLKLTGLANKLGLFFQIRDDYCNLFLNKNVLNKSFCEDLTEGKFSFPIIHCILSRPHDRKLLSILQQRTENVDVKTYAVEYMTECGSFAYTLNALAEIRDDILTEIKSLGGNPILVAMMTALSQDLWDDEKAPSTSPATSASATSSSSSLASSSSSSSASSTSSCSSSPFVVSSMCSSSGILSSASVTGAGHS